MTSPSDPTDQTDDAVAALLADATHGRRAALARLLSLVERGGPGARAVGRLCHPLGGQAYTVGITGAPGAGKSTLTNAVCSHVRDDGAGEGAPDRIAVLAIDPPVGYDLAAYARTPFSPLVLDYLTALRAEPLPDRPPGALVVR